jgi:predicted HAD superfamily phosphohydrolase YqeG
VIRFRVVHTATLREATDVAAGLGSLVVVDLDGTLVATGTPLTQLAPSVLKPLVELRAGGTALVIVTNRRRAQATLHGIPVVADARKPWTQRSIFSEPVACVIGDQFLTDGLLAARLGVLYAGCRLSIHFGDR